MSRYSNSFTVETEVTIEQITQSIDFEDILSAYDKGAADLLDNLDASEVVAWTVQQPEFTRTLPELLDDTDFQTALAGALSENQPAYEALMALKKAPARLIDFQPDVFDGLTLTVDGVTKGSVTPQWDKGFLAVFLPAPSLGDAVRQRDAEPLRFNCSTLEVAQQILTALAEQK